jgi:hypothetical protein
MALKFQIDTDSLVAQFKDFAFTVTEDLKKSMSNLATLTRTRIVEAAGRELHTTKKTYMDALSDAEEVTPGVWVISLDEKALFIEEGTDPKKLDMKPDLLKGRKHRVIPYHYDKGPKQNSNFTNAMVMEIRQTLKQDRKPSLIMKKGALQTTNRTPFKQIEYNPNGSPRIGKLHEYNIQSPIPGKGNTPALTRLSIYQKEVKNAQTGKVSISRDILTFRTVTDGEASEGKWVRKSPLKARKFMDHAMDLATADWEQQILPELIEKWTASGFGNK